MEGDGECNVCIIWTQMEMCCDRPLIRRNSREQEQVSRVDFISVIFFSYNKAFHIFVLHCEMLHFALHAM